MSDFLSENRLRWEYYAARTPLWADRIKEGGGFLDHEKHELRFGNDDLLENFYDNFGFELDEQPGTVQMMSLQAIPDGAWETLCKLLFPGELTILESSFKCRY